MTLPAYQLYQARHSPNDKKTSLAQLRKHSDSIIQTLELDDYVGEQLNLLLDGQNHNEINTADVRRRITSELQHAGRYISDPAPTISTYRPHSSPSRLSHTLSAHSISYFSPSHGWTALIALTGTWNERGCDYGVLPGELRDAARSRRFHVLMAAYR